MREPTTENHQALAVELAHRMKMDKIFEEAFPAHMEGIKNGAKYLPTDFECYKNLMNKFEEKCEKLDDYSLKYAKAFVQECETNTYKEGLESSLAKIYNACPEL